ncbi:MAG: RNA polymerase sigma factor [Lachnospiraceae bacterium]|nr:RNA polymerase sigma factor [Lachnospiraceae bacterium]
MQEKILVEQLKNGNREAFDILYEKYKSLAIRTAYLIMGNLADSEDVVQDTFVKVWMYADRIQNADSFQAWMLQILVRTAYRHAKKKRKEFPDEETVNRMENRTCASSLEKVIQMEEAERLKAAIKALPIRHRSVVVLYYYNQLGIKEIAGMLGIMEGTVKSRLHTARKRMKDILVNEERKSD